MISTQPISIDHIIKAIDYRHLVERDAMFQKVQSQ